MSKRKGLNMVTVIILPTLLSMNRKQRPLFSFVVPIPQTETILKVANKVTKLNFPHFFTMTFYLMPCSPNSVSLTSLQWPISCRVICTGIRLLLLDTLSSISVSCLPFFTCHERKTLNDFFSKWASCNFDLWNTIPPC